MSDAACSPSPATTTNVFGKSTIAGAHGEGTGVGATTVVEASEDGGMGALLGDVQVDVERAAQAQKIERKAARRNIPRLYGRHAGTI